MVCYYKCSNGICVLLLPSYRNENFAIWGQNLNFFIKTKQGGSLPILKNCSIQIPSGQLWMLLGPNGCGKSTLLKVNFQSFILICLVLCFCSWVFSFVASSFLGLYVLYDWMLIGFYGADIGWSLETS